MNERVCRLLVKRRAVKYDGALSELASILPCEYCGEWRNGLEMHHRQFRSRGGLWVPSNVIALCAEDHARATAERVHGTGLNVHTWEVAAAVPVTVWYEEDPVLLDDEGGYRLAA